MVDSASRSDLQALRRSGRDKVALLGILCAAALGAAVWSFFFRKHGEGNPEDPTKVLIVLGGDVSGYSVVLKDGGFDAAEGSLEAWVDKAAQEVPGLDPDEGSAVDHVLALADRYGYGFVAFERPATAGLADLEIEGGRPTFGPEVRFAVVSVGDFAFPHRVTTNPTPSEVLDDAGIVLLQALFAQPQLDALRPGHDAPDVGSIQRRDQLRGSLERLARVGEAESLVARVGDELESRLQVGERATPTPRRLGERTENNLAWPTPDGRVLTFGRSFRLQSRDAVRITLDLAPRETITIGPVEDASDDAPRACDRLLGGAISVEDSPRYALGKGGSALVVETLSEGAVLFVHDATVGVCPFRRVGGLPPRIAGIDGTDVPHASGRVARAGVVGGRAVVSVVGAGDPEDRLLLGMLDGVHFGTPVWWGPQTLVVPAHERGEDALVWLSLEDPLQVLRLGASVFEGVRDLHDVAVAPGRPSVLVTAGLEPRRLYRLDLPAGPGDPETGSPLAPQAVLAELFGHPPLPPEAVVEAREGLPSIVPLDSNRFVATTLTGPGMVRDPDVSADGRWAVFGIVAPALDRGGGDPDASGDEEIALVSLDDGAMRLLTRNASTDRRPRFTADGRFVLFTTQIEIPRTSWVLHAARVVPVP